MFIKIDLSSDIPIYIQLKNEIIKAIVNGELKEGDILPSVRNLAEQLGINLHTVNKAYNLLKEDGFITLNRKKKAIISMGNKKSEKDFLKLEELLTPIVNEYYCKGFDKEDFISVIDKILNKIGGNL